MFTTTDVLIGLDAMTGNASALAAMYRMPTDQWMQVRAYIYRTGLVEVVGQHQGLTRKGRRVRRAIVNGWGL